MPLNIFNIMKQYKGLTERIGVTKSAAQLQKEHEKASLAVKTWNEVIHANGKGKIRENQRSPKAEWIKNQRRISESNRDAMLNQFIVSDPHCHLEDAFVESFDCPIEVINDLLENDTEGKSDFVNDSSENTLTQISPQMLFQAEYPFNPKLNQAKEAGLLYKELIIGIINRSNLPKKIEDQLRSLRKKKATLKNSLSEDLVSKEIEEKIKEIEEKIKNIEGIFQPIVSQAYYGLKEAQAVLAKKKKRSTTKAERQKLPVITREIYHGTLEKVRSNIDNIASARNIEL